MKIRILGIGIKVIDDDSIDGMGLILHKKGEIHLHPAQCEEEKRQTLLHEALHAYDSALHGNPSLKEKEVCWISACWFEFIKNNPAFIRQILSHEAAAFKILDTDD
jgi:hypothetical protein